MVAHCAVRAEELRADFGNGGVLPAKPNTWQASPRHDSRWKWTYRSRLSSKPLKISLRGFMQLLLDHSDSYGRVWWGQTSLAKLAQCSDRTLRRYLAILVRAGLLRVEKQTFKSLTAAQRELGLPPPNRDDAGQAPNLLTLLFDGEPAFTFVPPRHCAQDKPRQDKPRPGVARTVPDGHVVQGFPWTKSTELPLDKMADDPLGSTYLTRNVEGDPEEPPHPVLVVEQKEFVAAQSSPEPHAVAARDSEAQAETPRTDAWDVLDAAYDAQFQRVYHGPPTHKRVTSDDKSAMSAHVVELTKHFERRLRECEVPLEKLPSSPMQLLADEALRAWFDSCGGGGFLRRVSHRMRELVQDLPYRVRKAVESLVDKLKPKPEPRRCLSPPMAPASSTNATGKPVQQDKPRPMKLLLPMLPEMHGAVIRRPERPPSTEPPISAEAKRIREGLSARRALREFAGDSGFACELEALARERGLSTAHVVRMLDGLSIVAAATNDSKPQHRKTAVFAAAIVAFDEMQRCEGQGAT
jgi:hypothetical protein